MKKLLSISLLLALLACLSTRASAQMFMEDFQYPAGDSLAAHGWLISSGGTTNAILTTASGLTFTGYPASGIGNAVYLTGTGQDVYGTYTPDSTGSVYASFMMKVDSAKTGDYFFSLTKTGSPSSMYARTFLKAVTGGYVIGCSKNNETPQTYGATVLAFGTTYFVVVKYTFVDGDKNDLVSVYVIPQSGSLATEPATPEAGPHNGAAVGDATSLGHVVLRQGSSSSGPWLTIDGIRIDSTWKGLFAKPMVYSVGTANVPGEDGHFASLKSACDTLNALSGAGITANMTFYITSDLTEPSNVALGPNTNGKTITFKPYTGVKPTITFTQTADNVGLSGGWAIGVKNVTTTSAANYGVTQADSTEHIIIDGSNTVGGTTRDLTIATAAGINGNTNPIRIFGNTNYITIKNLNVTTGQSVSYAVLITVRNSTVAGATGNYVPDFITVDNCSVTNTFGAAAQGIAISTSGTPTAFPTGVVFSNNKVTATTRGIFLNNAGDTEVYGNEISINQPGTGNLSEGIYALTIGLPTNTVNIYKNKIVQLSTGNKTTGAYGVYGIYIGSNGVYNVYDNIVTGMKLPVGFMGMAVGIGIVTPTTNGITANVYHNSVYMPNDTITVGATAPTHTAFYVNVSGASGTRVVNVMNNIFANDEKDYLTYTYYWSNNTLATMQSNYNNLYTAGGSGKIGRVGTADATTLADWKTAAAQDSNSVSGLPQFVSASDLHINTKANPASAASNAGTPIASVTKDIDGDTRDALKPDMGADEFTQDVTPTGPTVVTIGEARKDANNDLVPDHSITKDTLKVYGVIIGPSMQSTQTSYFMQDATGGINVFSFTPMAVPFVEGDSVFVIGTVQQFRGLTELVPGAVDDAHIGLIKHNAIVPAPKRMTLHEFVTNSDKYEGQLIELDTLYKATGTWPAAGANASVYLMNLSKADTVQMFIDLDTDVDGSTEPVYPINVVGIVSQYASPATALNSGFEIVPRRTTDITPIKVTGVETAGNGLPTTYELANNFPNPFNPATVIRFALPSQSMAKLVVYDMLGREVRTLVNGTLNAGWFETTWNGRNNAGVQVASGIYIYRMEAGSFVASKKMMMLK